MSTRNLDLDRHLREHFGALDTRPDFDERLMARVQAASRVEQDEEAARTRQRERERSRYRRSVLDLQTERRQRSLEGLGIALLLIIAGVSVWSRISGDVMDLVHQHGLSLLTALAVLIGAVPLVGLWAEDTHRSSNMSSVNQ